MGIPTASPQAGAAAPAAGRASRRALKNWRVRSRLLLLIAIPTLVAVVLGGIGIASSLRSAQSYQRVESLANLGQQIIVLTQALEEERDQTAFYIALGPNGGRATGSSANPAVRSQAALEQSVVTRSKNATDQAMATVSDLSSQIGGSYSAQTQQAAATARAALGELPYLRTVSISTELPALVVVQKYTQLIDDVLALNDQIAQSASDPQLAQTVRVLGLVSAMKEEASQQRAILAAALIQGKFGPGELDALNTAQSAQQSNLAAFDISADVGQRLLWNNSVDGSFTYLANSEELQALTLQNRQRIAARRPHQRGGLVRRHVEHHRLPDGLGRASAGGGSRLARRRAAQERHNRSDCGRGPGDPGPGGRPAAHHGYRQVHDPPAAAVAHRCP